MDELDHRPRQATLNHARPRLLASAAPWDRRCTYGRTHPRSPHHAGPFVRGATVFDLITVLPALVPMNIDPNSEGLPGIAQLRTIVDTVMTSASYCPSSPWSSRRWCGSQFQTGLRSLRLGARRPGWGSAATPGRGGSRPAPRAAGDMCGGQPGDDFVVGVLAVEPVRCGQLPVLRPVSSMKSGCSARGGTLHRHRGRRHPGRASRTPPGSRHGRTLRPSRSP